MKEKIQIPLGCRYMSDYQDLLNMLPQKGWYILNKTLCGCGGTTTFLDSDDDLILVSPRINMLESKHKQYPQTTYLFRESKNDKPDKLKERLRDYIYSEDPFHRVPRKILVTLDSYKHVVDVLSFLGRMERFKVVVDEFQCLMTDASYKGSTEMAFLELLRQTTPNVCFMSATPIDEKYLDYVEHFKGIPYYQLEWDAAMIETPNLKEVILKKNESPRIICKKIIEDYRRDGFFAQKVWKGEIVYSREICIYLNEVKSIIDVIKDNNLQPEEVTILCSDSTSQKTEIKRLGFTIGGQCTNKNNPVNKPFTFCTRASFEGIDLYSDNASTVIFVNAHKEWETHDISIDLPQILARQRLSDRNPFCRDAVIYYKTKSHPKTEEEIRKELDAMIQTSKDRIYSYENADSVMKIAYVSALRNQKESEQYKDCFLDVIDCGSNGYKLQINSLVILARLNLWRMQNHYYTNPIKLLAGIEDNMSNNYKQKPEILANFENCFYECGSWSNRMRMYCEFAMSYPQYRESLMINPYIPVEYHYYYDTIGTQRLAELEFREKSVREEIEFITRIPQIQEFVRRSFLADEFYPASAVKSKLNGIYSMLGINRSAHAVDIMNYLTVIPKKRTINGKRENGYIIK